MVKETSRDPGKLVSGMVGNVFISMFLMPTISAVFFLGLFYLLGYTHLLVGPFGFFRLLFLLSVIGSAFFFYILYKLYRAVRGATKHSSKETIKVESKIVD